jgi:hypothetical protein
LSLSENRPPWDFDIPVIGREHLADARLFADRLHLIDSLGSRKAGAVAELGVAVGDFSKALIQRYDPKIFYAIDLFQLHELESLWGRKPAEIFGAKTHLEYYLDRMAPFRDRLQTCQGDSANETAKLADASIDVIYIDGSHHYADVKRDCAVAREKIKPGGLLIFNDYILWSHLERAWYGVVPVVNDLVVNKGGRIIGFALQSNMYADIAIQM